LLVGVVESLAVLFFPEAAKVSMFVIMAVVLLVRPQGLFGRAGLMN
jgi:branched-chain amino acid transport system permease protein